MRGLEINLVVPDLWQQHLEGLGLFGGSAALAGLRLRETLDADDMFVQFLRTRDKRRQRLPHVRVLQHGFYGDV